MMENAICQHTLPRCGSGGGLPTYIVIYSFHSSIRSIKRWFLVNLGVAVAEGEEEEADVEATVEETDSSGVDGGGDQRSIERWSRERRRLREFWDEKQNDTGWDTIYKFKNISNDSLTTTATDSFEIWTEAVLV
jgi:hypothetical protein